MVVSIPQSPLKISDIKSNLLRPSLTSHFGVTIGGAPSEVMKALSITQQTQLNLLCSEAVLPGSNLALMNINNDYTGVTERHAYRRVFDDRINLTFYVDASNYLPIKFFETWHSYIMNESRDGSESKTNYNYRLRYPDGESPGSGYTAEGLTVTKFERDYRNSLVYQFIKSYPISVSSMPVTYDASNLLKCTVAMTYLRYILNTAEKTKKTGNAATSTNAKSLSSQFSPSGQHGWNQNLQGWTSITDPTQYNKNLSQNFINSSGSFTVPTQDIA